MAESAFTPSAIMDPALIQALQGMYGGPLDWAQVMGFVPNATGGQTPTLAARIAELDAKAKMASASAQAAQAAATRAIGEGNIQLGYAQLAESRRQYDISQQLEQQKYQLTYATQIADISANPRNWVALSYLAGGQQAPAGANGFQPDPYAALQAAQAPQAINPTSNPHGQQQGNTQMPSGVPGWQNYQSGGVDNWGSQVPF